MLIAIRLIPVRTTKCLTVACQEMSIVLCWSVIRSMSAILPKRPGKIKRVLHQRLQERGKVCRSSSRHLPLPNVPEINSCTAGSPIETEKHARLCFPRIYSVNDIQSVSEAAVEISPLLLPRNSSTVSSNTESYSSPESPVQISVLALVRHRDSWRVSDYDLSSEEPLMAFYQTDENGELKNKSSKTGDKQMMNSSTSSMVPSLKTHSLGIMTAPR